MEKEAKCKKDIYILTRERFSFRESHFWNIFKIFKLPFSIRVAISDYAVRKKKLNELPRAGKRMNKKCKIYFKQVFRGTFMDVFQ